MDQIGNWPDTYAAMSSSHKPNTIVAQCITYKVKLYGYTVVKENPKENTKG